MLPHQQLTVLSVGAVLWSLACTVNIIVKVFSIENYYLIISVLLTVISVELLLVIYDNITVVSSIFLFTLLFFVMNFIFTLA